MMRVFRGLPAQLSTDTALTIGNFDGVHRGHRKLLSTLINTARDKGLRSMVLTFEPHPLEFFATGTVPARLASLREKLLLLSGTGVDAVIVCRFNATFAAINASDFVEHMLVQQLRVKHLLVGDDFCYGAKRQGTIDTLRDAAAHLSFSVAQLAPFEHNGLRVSSSAVRDALEEDRLQDAAQLLGRVYSLAGRVTRGQQLGRTLGFPTANIQLRHRTLPLRGVYIVWVEGLGEGMQAGVANIGFRPSVTHGNTPLLEVHLLHFDKDCYGAHLRINFIHKLRDEQKFASLDHLKAAIGDDIRAAHHWLAQHPESHQHLETFCND